MKKLFIVMLSVFALMLVGCSNPANSNPAGSDGKPAPDPYLLGLDDCEVTLAEIETGVQDSWRYVRTCIHGGTESKYGNVPGNIIKDYLRAKSGTDIKYYACADFSKIVKKYKDTAGENCYEQCTKL